MNNASHYVVLDKQYCKPNWTMYLNEIRDLKIKDLYLKSSKIKMLFLVTFQLLEYFSTPDSF